PDVLLHEGHARKRGAQDDAELVSFARADGPRAYPFDPLTLAHDAGAGIAFHSRIGKRLAKSSVHNLTLSATGFGSSVTSLIASACRNPGSRASSTQVVRYDHHSSPGSS